MRYPGEFLPWRREQGRECKSCNNWIKLAKLDRDALVEECQDEEKAANFRTSVLKYEDLQNSLEAKGFPRGRACWANNKELANLAAAFKKARVSQTMTSKLQTKKCLGNLWPLPVYKARFKKEAEKKKIASVKHQGQVLKGVILDPSYGKAIGVIELASIGEKGAELDITYDDAEDEVRPGQLADSWKRMESMCAVGASADKRAVKEDGSIDDSVPQTATIKMLSKRKKEADDSDDNLLGDLWGEDLFTSRNVPDDEGTPYTKRARPKQQLTPRTDPTRPKASPTGQKGAVKRAKDLAAAEQATLAGKQFLGMLENPTIVSSVTWKSFEAAKKKVAEKLTPNWVAIFTAEYDPQQLPAEEEPGVALLKELKLIDAKMQAASGFVELLNADSKTPKAGASLRLAADEARTAGIKLPGMVDEISLTREMKDLLAVNDFGSYKNLICAGSSASEGLQLLPKSARQGFQDKTIIRDLCNMMRPKGQVELTHDFLKNVLEAELLNNELKTDLEKFVVLFSPQEHDIDKVKQIKADIEASPTHRFHKMLTLFPTGCAVIEACAKYEQLLAADRGWSLELQNLKSILVELEDISPKHFSAGTESVTIESSAGLYKKYTDFRESLVKITACCSAQFETNHADDLKACHKKLDTMKQSLLVWADQNMNENIEKAFKTIVGHSRDHTEIVGERNEATWARGMMLKINKAIDEGFKTAEYLGLSNWMSKEDVQKYSDRTDNLKNAMNLVKGALETYIAGYANNLPFNIEDPAYNAWVDWINSVGDGSEYMSIPMMPEYLEMAKSSIVHHGLKALNLSLKGTKDCESFVVALQDAWVLSCMCTVKF